MSSFFHFVTYWSLENQKIQMAWVTLNLKDPGKWDQTGLYSFKVKPITCTLC